TGHAARAAGSGPARTGNRRPRLNMLLKHKTSLALALALSLVAASVSGCAAHRAQTRRQRVFVRHGKIETVDVVTFEYNSDRLRPQSLLLLDEVAVAIRTWPQVNRVRIEGHTDEVGGREFNLALSVRRAQAVKRYLVEQGQVPAVRLETRGYGR